MRSFIDVTPHMMYLIEKKYPGWQLRSSDDFRKIGRTNDIEYLRMIEDSLCAIIPYTQVAIGAAIGGHEDMLSYVIHRTKLNSSMGFRLRVQADNHGHHHLHELLKLHFGDRIFDNPD